MELKKISASNLAQAIATRANDPYFTNALRFLPNPDPILRKLNRDQEAYEGIGMDAHVLGELRSVRSALLGFEWRIESGGDAPADMRALELCQQVMERRPAPGMHWSDVIWTMAQAVFRGFSVHEVVWERQDSHLVPAAVLDRPQRRFLFGADNDLRLKTRTSPVEGIDLGARKWLLTRHMPSQENPYGVAVFSSCFWPYTFKHGGFRFFVKFAEKYGIPWAIGKYPQGAPKEDQDALADGLRDMIEDAVAAIQEGSGIELLSAGDGKAAVHERLINLCNREMSKALTSQTLATEIQGDGSRAASETHREREVAVNESDRKIVADTFNELLAWVTELNIPNARAPHFEFWEEGEARKKWVEVLDGARQFLDVPKTFAHERLQIPLAEQGEEVLPRSGPTDRPVAFNRHRCAGCGEEHSFAAAAFPDQDELEKMLASVGNEELQRQAEELLNPVFDLIRKQGPDEALGHLAEAYPQMDDVKLQQLLARMIFVAETWGRLNGEDDA